MKLPYLIIIILTLFANICSANNYYVLGLHYSHGNISLKKLEVKPLEEMYNIPGLYVAATRDFDGKIVNMTFFDIPLEIFYDTVDERGEINGGGSIILNETDFVVMAPYYPNAKEIGIFNKNYALVLRIDVSKYSKEKTNQVTENTATILPEQNQKRGAKSEMSGWTNYIIILMVLIMIIIVWLLYRQAKKINRPS